MKRYRYMGIVVEHEGDELRVARLGGHTVAATGALRGLPRLPDHLRREVRAEQRREEEEKQRRERLRAVGVEVAEAKVEFPEIDLRGAA